MNRNEFLLQLADQYRSEGYDVTMAAEATLPLELSNLRDHVDLIARKNGESIAIEVNRRDQLYQLNPPEAARIQALPGWSYDLAVYPPDWVDEIPLEDGEPSPEYVESLLAEAQRTLDVDQHRAAFLVAWSAIETAMRTAARREDLDIDRGVPPIRPDDLVLGRHHLRRGLRAAANLSEQEGSARPRSSCRSARAGRDRVHDRIREASSVRGAATGRRLSEAPLINRRRATSPLIPSPSPPAPRRARWWRRCWRSRTWRRG
jgi:hypothetical protein